MRTLLVVLIACLLTPPFAAILVIAAIFKVPDRPGSVFWWIPRAWSRAVLWAAGVELRVHHPERIGDGRNGVVFASNHVSWFDVFAVSATLPRCSFVAKAELMRIPFFGAGARAIGTVPIERDNRKSAFASYETAAEIVRAGRPIVVFPEGTRGESYPLRAFKKGPFVLAIASGAPILPVVVHGTIAVMPKHAWRIRSGVVDLHFLEAVPTTGLTYDDRDRLSQTVRERIASVLGGEYDVAGAAGEDADGSDALDGDASPRASAQDSASTRGSPSPTTDVVV
jgi:1-acyl-sn-glycerol-3-phosphate acyltransferase